MAWIGPAISGGASLLSGFMGSSAASDAADSMANQANQNRLLQKSIYEQQRRDQEPFRQTGVQGNARLAELLGLDVPVSSDMLSGSDKLKYDENTRQIEVYMNLAEATGSKAYVDKANALKAQNQQMLDAYAAAHPKSSDFGSLTRNFSLADLNADPVYQTGLQFGLDQGTGAINSRAIQNGSYDSGATLKELTRYATDYGNTKANDAFNRWNAQNTNTYNRLAGISGSGQTATSQIQEAGSNYGAAAGQALSDIGNARAAGIMGSANAWGGALKGVNDAISQYYKNINKI